MKRFIPLLAIAWTLAFADVQPYTPGTVATFGGNAGKFNTTVYLTLDKGYDLTVTSMGVCLTKPCQPDVVQVYTRTGTRIADIALRPSDAWGGVTLMLPAGAYQLHLTGSGALTQLTINTRVSK